MMTKPKVIAPVLAEPSLPLPDHQGGVALVLPYANAQAMNLHLEEISGQGTRGCHAGLLLDGAGWHQTGGKLKVLSNISLLHLPPYSPELNPVDPSMGSG